MDNEEKEWELEKYNEERKKRIIGEWGKNNVEG